MSGGGTPGVDEVVGSDGVLGSVVRDQRLAEAMAMGVPAFVRRAQRVEAAVAGVFESARAERSKRLAILFDVGRRLEACRLRGDELPEWVLAVLEELRAEEGFGKRQIAPPRSAKRWSADLAERVERFNERWDAYLRAVSLEKVHEEQRDYNRYYPIERHCALRRVAQPKFEPLELMRREELIEGVPGLPGVVR